MPAPEKASTARVVEAARDLAEERGAAAVTMQAVAERVGVRAPSLYKRVRSREDLLAQIDAATLAELTGMLAAAEAEKPQARIVALARTMRAFAARWPVGYGLLFSPAPASERRDAALATAAGPLLIAVTQLVGEERSLDAARLLTAWLHGFIAMEQSGAFRLGGDLDAAFDYALERLIGAIER